MTTPISSHPSLPEGLGVGLVRKVESREAAGHIACPALTVAILRPHPAGACRNPVPGRRALAVGIPVSIFDFRIPGKKRIQLGKLVLGSPYGLRRRVDWRGLVSIFVSLQFARFHQFSSVDQALPLLVPLSAHVL